MAFGDAAWVALFGMAAVLAVVALVWQVVRRRPGGGITAKLGSMQIQLEAVHAAVNDRPKDGPTLSAQVMEMAGRLDAIDTKVDTLTDALAAHVLANPGLPITPPRGAARPRYGY